MFHPDLTGSCWSPVQTLPVAPLWCDLGFFPNSRGNKAAANLRPNMVHSKLNNNCIYVYRLVCSNCTIVLAYTILHILNNILLV